jgi:RNA polymerase sigma-32 factor
MNNNGSHFDLRRCVPMTRAEELECATEYLVTRDPRLATRLVMANMRLVVTIAHGYRRADCDMLDLVQEGNLGLVQAVEHYDPKHEVRLCSYAAWWIRAYILKFVMDNWRLVKAGTTQAQRRLFFRLQKERSKLERNGEQVGTRQLAAALGVREKDVLQMMERFAGGEMSLDAPVRARDPETRAIGDSLGAAPALRPDARVEASQFAEILRGKLRTFGDDLRGREATIFRRRLLNDEPVTLAILAADFGVTRERTRQLEQRLKGRIRCYLKKELGDSLPLGAAA